MVELLPLLPKGSALDLACGRGRNALFLAGQGWHVCAADFSSAGLESLKHAAEAAGIPARSAGSLREAALRLPPGITLVQTDLEAASLPADSFDLILCVNYLQRSFFPAIEKAIRPGGAVLYETYTRRQLDFAEGPRNPAHLLEPGELRNAFPDLEAVFFREFAAGKGIATILARKPAGSAPAGTSAN